MSSLDIVGDSKNFFCRDQYWQLMNTAYQRPVFKSVRGATLRKCNRENCRGAHCEDEIQTLPSVHQFKMCDKSKINLVSMYNSIIDQFENSKSKVKHQEYIDKLDNFKSLNFVQLLNLWFDITCFYRKLKKDIINGTSDCDLYSSVDQIPQFFIEEENYAWGLERLTKLCPKNLELKQKIRQGKAIIWDICIGSINCKKGCHNIEYMVCNDDLLHGTCDCMSKEDFNNKKEQYNEQIKKFTDLLSPSKESGFESNLKPRKVKQYQEKIRQLRGQKNSMIRKVHLSEQGLIPFDLQMKMHLENLARIEQERIESLEKQATKKEERMDQLKNKKVKKILKKPVF